MSFMAFYAAFIFPASYVTDRCGLRWTLIIGTGLNCLGAWIKTFSVQPDRFYVVLIGHSIVAIAQVTPLDFSINLLEKSCYCYFSLFPPLFISSHFRSVFTALI